MLLDKITDNEFYFVEQMQQFKRKSNEISSESGPEHTRPKQ
jgi:hypothetical protein